MTEPVLSPGKWIIAFYDGGPRNWWDRFTRPGFRHCFAVRYLEPMDAWTLVDWNNHGLIIDFLPKRFIDAMIVGVNDAGGVFLEAEVQPTRRRIVPLTPLYCVSAVKDLIGLRAWRVITPWQLYCALMKRGAQRMFDLSHVKEDTDGQSIQEAESAES
jgi:hypothetical protein